MASRSATTKKFRQDVISPATAKFHKRVDSIHPRANRKISSNLNFRILRDAIQGAIANASELVMRRKMRALAKKRERVRRRSTLCKRTRTQRERR